ncbi:MAG: serine/threonine-protein kinase PknK [Anaerolineales bacterium]
MFRKNTQEEILDRRYVLKTPLGKGGMGAVFRAYDRLNNGDVALKLVTAPPRDLDFASRSGGLNVYLALAQEFKVLASLRHPHIISVLNYGFDEQRRPYFTMDLLENAQSPARATFGKGDEAKVQLLIQICQALAYLHRRDIIHRDLKPANVRIVQGEARVLDFGLSIIRAQHEGDGEHIVGTIEYMAPELLRQAPPSVASDLYAVGVIGYELFTGEYLFEATDIRTLARQIFNKIPDPSNVGNQRVAAVLSRLLAKDPDMRYRNAEETIAALSAAIDQDPPGESIAIRESFLQAATLVGREDELAQVTPALETLREGRGAAWLIGGESGVGKSRLVEELRIRALVDGIVVLRGEGITHGRQPYQIWLNILRGLVISAKLTPQQAGILSPLVPDIEDLTGVKPQAPDSADPQIAQRRLIETVYALFRSQERPMLAVLEDLHWAGIESVTLLRELTAHLDELPVVFVSSYRDDEQPNLPRLFPAAQHMKLGRLEDNEIAALSSEMLGKAGRDPELVEFLRLQTEGNVFFLVEVVRALAEEAGQLADISSTNLPAAILTGGVERIIQRRLGRVPEPLVPYLRLAAISGRYLDERLMLYTFQGNDNRLQKFLTYLSNIAVLDVQEDTWRFAHDKLREGVLQHIPEDDVPVLHREVAQGIENTHLYGPQKAAALAYHWHHAGDGEKEAQYAALAGEQALNSGSYEEAVNLLGRALDLMPSQPDPETAKRQANILRQLGAAHQGLGHMQDAHALYEDSLHIYREVDYKWGIAFALSDLGHVAYAMQEYEESYRYFRESIQTAMSVRAQTVALAAIIGIARLMRAAQRDDWAVELCTFVIDHMAADQQTADRAREILDDLQDRMAPEDFEAAKQAGAAKRLSEIVEELI